MKSGPVRTTNYLYDGANLLGEVDQSGNALARYTQGGIDEEFSELRSGTTGYYLQDGLGSVTSLSNGAGSLDNTYTYDSFGNLIASTGTLANPFQYTGREFDSESGRYFYRARYYDPALGQFVSEDPVGFEAGVNFYRYAANSPPNLIDPTGFKPCCPKQEEDKIREFLADAREYLNTLKAGGEYKAKHGQVLGSTKCFGFRAPNGKPSKEPLGQGVTTIYVDQEKEPCIYECVAAHERVHKKMCETLGTRYNLNLTVQQKEIPAFEKEIGCYLQMLRSAGLGASPQH